MVKLEITDYTSWHELKEQFSKQTNGALLQLKSYFWSYDDGNEYSPLVSIIGLDAKRGTVICEDKMTVADFETECKNTFNLDIKVKATYNSDASPSTPFEAVLRLKCKENLEKMDSGMTLGELRKKQESLNSMAALESDDETVRKKALDESYKRTAHLFAMLDNPALFDKMVAGWAKEEKERLEQERLDHERVEKEKERLAQRLSGKPDE